MNLGMFRVPASSLALLCLLGATCSAQTEAGRVSTPVEHPPLNPATDSQAKPEMGPKVVLTILVPMECIHLSNCCPARFNIPGTGVDVTNRDWRC